MWVSGRYLCRAFEHAIDDEPISFGVYNLVSHNPGCGGRSLRWRVTATSFVQGCWRRCPLPMVQPASLAWVPEVGLRAFGDRLAGALR